MDSSGWKMVSELACLVAKLQESLEKRISEQDRFLPPEEYILEECGELTQAIQKFKRVNVNEEHTMEDIQKALTNVEEETIDVITTIMEWWYCHSIRSTTIIKGITYKLDRAIERLQSEGKV